MMVELRRAALAVALAVALGGCMIGPDYFRPKVDAPQAFRYSEQDARALADTEWWKEFGDPVIDGLIAEALANNKNAQIATANVEAATSVITQTRAGLFPQVGYQGVAGRQRLSERNATPVPPTVPNPQDAYQALLGASWEIDLWGRIRRLSESARASALATEEARRGAILTLVASVATSYLQLRSLDYQLEIAKRTLDTYAESVRLFELQFKYGQISLLTLEQAKSQYESALAPIPQIERNIALTENAISILLGRNPGPVARGKPLAELKLPGVPAGLPSQPLERRPGIARAEQPLTAANLTRLIRRFRPDTVTTGNPEGWFYGDEYLNHPDHRAAAQAACEAVFHSAGTRLIFAELLAEKYKPHDVRRLYIHCTEKPNTWVDITGTMDLKIQALQQHASQVDPNEVGKWMTDWAEEEAKDKGMKYAEAYRVMILRKDDEEKIG